MTQEDNAIVFAYDYYPGVEFDVTSQLQQQVTVNILNGPDDEGIPEIDTPSDYGGYIINYNLGDDSTQYAYMFTTGSVDEDDSLTFGEDASIFSTELNLIQTSVEG